MPDSMLKDDVNVNLLEGLNQGTNIEKYANGIFYQTLAKNTKDLKQIQIVRKATEIEFKARQKCIECLNNLQNLQWQQESLVENLIPESTFSIKVAEKINVDALIQSDFDLNIAIRNASIMAQAALATYKRYTGLDFKQ